MTLNQLEYFCAVCLSQHHPRCGIPFRFTADNIDFDP